MRTRLRGRVHEGFRRYERSRLWVQVSLVALIVSSRVSVVEAVDLETALSDPDMITEFTIHVGGLRSPDFVSFRSPITEKDLQASPDGEASRLHGACLIGNLELVREEVAGGADINLTDDEGQTPLFKLLPPLPVARAIGGEGIAYVQSSITPEPYEPEPIVSYLLEQGAAIDHADKMGRTPLHVLVSDKGVVSLLITAGADVNQQDGSGKSPLHYAAEANVISVEVTANSQNTVFLKYQEPVGVVTELLQAGADFDLADELKQTALHLAASHNHVTTMMRLLEAGADGNLQDKNGDTALHIWLRDVGALTDDAKTLRTLLQLGVDSSIANAQGRTPLHEAAARGHVGIAKALAADGGNVKRKDRKGVTPLDEAKGSNRSLFKELRKMKRYIGAHK